METKNFNLLEELSENEIEHFFAEGNEETISAWTEGDGRSQSNYEILRLDNDGCFVCGSQGSSVYVLRSEHYGFDDFNQPTYHFITMKSHKHQDSYGVFCMSDRLLAFDICDIDDNDLDARWSKAIREYEKFLGSEFNVDTKSELDCIDEYLNNQ